MIDLLVTKRSDRLAAKRFFRRILKHQSQAPRQLITDKLRSYPAAHREIFPSVGHRPGQTENNRAEVSHQLTHQQERQMRRFNSPSSTLSLRSRSHSEPIPSRSSSSEGRSSSIPPSPGFFRLERGDVRGLLSFWGESLFGSVNLTVPPETPFLRLFMAFDSALETRMPCLDTRCH